MGIVHHHGNRDEWMLFFYGLFARPKSEDHQHSLFS